MPSRAAAFLLSVVLPLAACASASDPGLRRYADAAKPAVSATIPWEQSSFAGGGGTQLFAQSWRPPLDAPVRGVVAIHHGLADHSSRYAPFAIRLAEAGYAVWAFDMRGHGRSAGPRVLLASPDILLDDLEAFLSLVRHREPGLPLFLYGHSVGGLVSSLYAIERQPALAGLLLAAPAIAFDAPPLQAAAVQLTNAIAPDLAILETPHDDFSSIPSVVDAMDRDPLIAQSKGPARTVRTILAAAERVWAAPHRLSLPLFAFHGDIDKLTAPSGSRDLVAQATGRDRTFRLYPGLAHDVLYEPSSPQVAAELHAWLDAHTGGPAVAFPSSPTTPLPRLAGDPRGRAVLVEADLRSEFPFSESGAHSDVLGDNLALSSGLRARLAVGNACGLNYLGGLDLRAGYVDGLAYEATAHLLGAAWRSNTGALLSLTTGLTAGYLAGDSYISVPVELAAEVPLSSVRLLARTSFASRLSGDEYPYEALEGVDELSVLLGVRLFPDRRYWGTTLAGAGPFIAATYRNLGRDEAWGVAFGAHLWGGN